MSWWAYNHKCTLSFTESIYSVRKGFSILQYCSTIGFNIGILQSHLIVHACNACLACHMAEMALLATVKLIIRWPSWRPVPHTSGSSMHSNSNEDLSQAPGPWFVLSLLFLLKGVTAIRNQALIGEIFCHRILEQSRSYSWARGRVPTSPDLAAGDVAGK